MKLFQNIVLSRFKLTPLEHARTRTPLSEILLWMTPSEPPKALQASECSELLDPMRASCLILAQHQPGKFDEGCRGSFVFLQTQRRQVLLLVRPLRTISPRAAEHLGT